MKLFTRFDYPKVQFDKDNDVVLFTGLEAPPVDTDNRQPLNLCVVLDISGSMMGDKIERMKRTTQILIDHLTTQDRLGIVIFSSNYTRLAAAEIMTAERKTELKARVATLHGTCATNISGAMLLGFETLGVKENMINRILLLTDGLPNGGETTILGLVELVNQRPKGMSLSTIGFGTDHDPKLMLSMAQAGGGNYYFIENADQINTAFAQELGGLISCFAQNIKVEVTFKPGVKDVEVINKAWEWAYENDILTIRIPDLYADETQKILTKVSLEKRTSVLPRDVTIADVRVTYKNLINKKDEKIDNKAKIDFVKAGQESQERDSEIAKHQATIEAAEAQKQAVELANVGDFVGAQHTMHGAVMGFNACGSVSQANEAQLYASCLNEDSYSKSVSCGGLSTSYGASRGRAAGAANAGTKAQKSMLRSFEDLSADAANVAQPTAKPVWIKDDKKQKGKKHNPMTE